jgi:hypothetical protein
MGIKHRASKLTVFFRVQQLMSLRLNKVKTRQICQLVSHFELSGKAPWKPINGKHLTTRQIKRYIEKADKAIVEFFRGGNKKPIPTRRRPGRPRCDRFAENMKRKFEEERKDLRDYFGGDFGSQAWLDARLKDPKFTAKPPPKFTGKPPMFG